jgi:ferredoxin-type protein NapG
LQDVSGKVSQELLSFRSAVTWFVTLLPKPHGANPEPMLTDANNSTTMHRKEWRPFLVPVHSLKRPEMRSKSANAKREYRIPNETGITRRDLLKGSALFLGGAVVLAGTKKVPSSAVVRPPGLIDEHTFLAACNRCGRCWKACPTVGLSAASPFTNLLSAQTPQLTGFCRVFNELNDNPPDPGMHAQWVQSGAVGTPCMKCVLACPTGALKQIDIRDAKMGLAQLVQSTCLAWRNGSCNRCYEVCPVSAIEEAQPYQPVIDASKCIGCNQCYVVCPTYPKSVWVNPVI